MTPYSVSSRPYPRPPRWRKVQNRLSVYESSTATTVDTVLATVGATSAGKARRLNRPMSVSVARTPTTRYLRTSRGRSPDSASRTSATSRLKLGSGR